MRLITSRLLVAVGCVLSLGCAEPAKAGWVQVLYDNFDSENGGIGQLNYFGFANWNVIKGAAAPPGHWAFGTPGSVDLKGYTGVGIPVWDLRPGNGLYVDLNGSTSSTGGLQSKSFFGPALYRLTFDLAGPYPEIDWRVTIQFGSFTETVTLSGSTPFTTFQRQIDLTAPSQLTIFSEMWELGNSGPLLDNVRLEVFVSEPSALAALLTGLFGLAWAGRRSAAGTASA